MAGSALVIERQRLARPTIQKMRKSTKKSVKYFLSDPCFAAKERFFSSKKWHGWTATLVSCCRCICYVAPFFALPSRLLRFLRFFAAKPLGNDQPRESA
jgi:hypothetical protein